jgi:ATP-dependent DNA ligase
MIHLMDPASRRSSGRRRAADHAADEQAVDDNQAASHLGAERLPEALRRPFDVALARTVERMPAASALPGGTVYEPKWDGFRVALTRDGPSVRLWSRQGKDLGGAFPEVLAAGEEHVPPGCAIDGEVVCWKNDRLDFDALQRRLSATARTIGRLVRDEPVSYVVFDLLAVAGRDVRDHPYHVRRALLEELATGWEPPFTLCPSTRDRSQAEEWMRDYPVAGVEGIVAKGADQGYAGGRREWLKVKRRNTFELICGAVSGTIEHPETLILGRFVDGELRVVGRTAPVARSSVSALRAQLHSPRRPHPWPTVIRSRAYDRFNKRGDTEVTLVEPFVVEVSADTSLSGESLRHAARFIRTRPELAVDDVPTG